MRKLKYKISQLVKTKKPRIIIMFVAILACSAILVTAWVTSRVHYIRQDVGIPGIKLDVEMYNKNASWLRGRTIDDKEENQIHINSSKTVMDENLTFEKETNSLTAYVSLDNKSDINLDIYTRILINNSDIYNSLPTYLNSCVVDITDELNKDGSGKITDNALEIYAQNGNGQIKGAQCYSYYNEGSRASKINYYGTDLKSLQYLKQIQKSLISQSEHYYRIEIWFDGTQEFLSSDGQMIDLSVEIVAKQENQPVDEEPDDKTFEITTEQEFLEAVNLAKTGNTILVKNDIVVNDNVILYKAVNLVIDNCNLNIKGDLHFNLTSTSETPAAIYLYANGTLDVGGNLVALAQGTEFNIIGNNHNRVCVGMVSQEGFVYADTMRDNINFDKGFKLKYVDLLARKEGIGNYSDASIYLGSETHLIVDIGAKVGTVHALDGATNIYITNRGEITGGINLQTMRENTPFVTEAYIEPVSQSPNGQDQIYIKNYGEIGPYLGDARFYLPSWAKSYLEVDTKTTPRTTANCNTRICYDASAKVGDVTDFVLNDGENPKFTGKDIELSKQEKINNVFRLKNLDLNNYGKYQYKEVTYNNAYRIVISEYNYQDKDGSTIKSDYGAGNFNIQCFVVNHFLNASEDDDKFAYDKRMAGQISDAIAQIDYIEIVYSSDTDGLNYSDIAYAGGLNPKASSLCMPMSGVKYLNLKDAKLAANTLPNDPTRNMGALENSKITGIELPETLTTISSRALYNCMLTKLSIPASVSTIESKGVSTSASNAYGGYLFVTFETSSLISGSLTQGFDINDKTYLFINSGIDLKLHDYSKYITASTGLVNDQFVTETKINKYWWYYIYAYADMYEEPRIISSNNERVIRFVRERGKSYELALFISNVQGESIYKNSKTHYAELFPEKLNGKYVTAIGDRAYVHSNVEIIGKLDFVGLSNYTQIGKEAFRRITFNSRSQTITYQPMTINCSNANDFRFGNINYIGDLAFEGTKAASTHQWLFTDKAEIGYGAFLNVSTLNNSSVAVVFSGRGTIGDYAFSKGNTVFNIRELQLANVNSIGSYAFKGTQISSIPYRKTKEGSAEFSGMKYYGQYIFQNALIGSETNRSYEESFSSKLFLDLSPGPNVSVENSYLFSGAKIYGAVIKITDAEKIDSTVFSGSQFYVSKINLDGAGKLCTDVFYDNLNVILGTSEGNVDNLYCDVSALNVSEIACYAFRGYYFGKISIGLQDENLIAKNNTSPQEGFIWGGISDYTKFANNNANQYRVQGGIFGRNSSSISWTSAKTVYIKELYIDGAIPCNTGNSGLGGCRGYDIVHENYISGVDYGSVGFSDTFSEANSGIIREKLFAPVIDTTMPTYLVSIDQLNLDNVKKVCKDAFFRSTIGNMTSALDGIEIEEKAFERSQFTLLNELIFADEMNIGDSAFYASTFNSLEKLEFGYGCSLGISTFESATFSRLEELSFGTDCLLGTNGFYSTSMPCLESLVVGARGILENYCFQNITIGTSENVKTRTTIRLDGVSSVGEKAFYKMTTNSENAPNLFAQNVGMIQGGAFGTNSWNEVVIGLTDENKLNADYCWGSLLKNWNGNMEYAGIFASVYYGDSNVFNKTNIKSLIIDGDFPVGSNNKCLGSWRYRYTAGENQQRFLYYGSVTIKNCSQIPEKAFYADAGNYDFVEIGTLINNCANTLLLGSRCFGRVSFTGNSSVVLDKMSIGEYAFELSKFTRTPSVVISEGVKVGNYGFSNASFSGMTMLTINKNVTVGNYGFSKCSLPNLQTMKVREGVSLGDYCFSEVSFPSMTSLSLSTEGNEKPIKLGDHGFYKASFGAASIEISGKIEIGTYAFANVAMSVLKTLTIGAGIEIPAFCFCESEIGTKLSDENTNITINGVSSVGEKAFYRMTTNSAFAPNLSAQNVGKIYGGAFGANSWNEIVIGLNDENKKNPDYCWGCQIKNWNGNMEYAGIFASVYYGDSTLYNKTIVNSLIIDGEFPVNSPSKCLGSWKYRTYSGEAQQRFLYYGSVTIKNCSKVPDKAFYTDSGNYEFVDIRALSIDSTNYIEIGDYAFGRVRANMGNWNLSGVKSIGNYSFAFITPIAGTPAEKAVFSKLYEISGDCAFYGNTAINYLEFGMGTKSIYGGNNFYGMTSLTTIKLNRYEATDGSRYKITVLEHEIPKASMPAALSHILVSDDSAVISNYTSEFLADGGTNFWHMYLDKFVTFIEDDAFEDEFNNLYKIALLEEGGNELALRELVSMDESQGTNLAIPNVLQIGEVQYNVVGLERGLLASAVGKNVTSIEIPASIKYIDMSLFDYGENLSYIVVDSKNETYKAIGDDGDLGDDSLGDDSLSDGNCTQGFALTSYDGSILYRIAPNAFETEGAKLTINNRFIYEGALKNCRNIEAVSIASSVEVIGSNCFDGSNIRSWTFLGSTPPMMLGNRVFGDIKTISTLNPIAQFYFAGIDGLKTYRIIVPDSCLDTYLKNPSLAEYRPIVEEGEFEADSEKTENELETESESETESDVENESEAESEMVTEIESEIETESSLEEENSLGEST